jgi:hypothetical protein
MTSHTRRTPRREPRGVVKELEVGSTQGYKPQDGRARQVSHPVAPVAKNKGVATKVGDAVSSFSSVRTGLRSEQNAARVYADGPNFLRLLDRIQARADLSSGAKILYADLKNIDAKEKKGRVAPYQKTLAERHHVSQRQIRRYVEELESGFLVTDEKRGKGRSSVYFLHDSWDVEGSDDLLQPWRVTVLDRSDVSRTKDVKGHLRPTSKDKSAPLADRSVLSDGTKAAHPLQKNIKRRTTRQQPQKADQPIHSVSVSPPKAVLPGRCLCAKECPYWDSEIEIWLAESSDWDAKLGRTTFVIKPGQLHFHPSPAEFLKIQLALIVFWFEKAHQRRFVESGSRLRYRGSPYTSLDVQRGALLTLERNPSLAVTDLVRAAKAGNLTAPTPRFILRAMERRRGRSGDGGLGTAHLEVLAACRRGLHEPGVDEFDLGASNEGRPRHNARALAAKPTKSYTLARRFDERVTASNPLAAGNIAALARHISEWRKEGVTGEVIQMMIEEFVDKGDAYCPNGTAPWRAFVGKRSAILKSVEERFVDQHSWDDDFQERYGTLFGKHVGGNDDD